jgi:hypothetical protein
MTTLFLKPAEPGAVVRFPGDPRRVLAADGEDLDLTPFWQRRINDGSVVIAQGTAGKKEGRK